MGYNTAHDLNTWAKDTKNAELAKIRLGVALEQHLRYNHFPPVPYCMIEPCKAAINAYNEEEPDREIDLPAGISWRGATSAPAWAIIDGHHLQAFLESDESEEGEE